MNQTLHALFRFGVIFKLEHIYFQGLSVLTHLAKHDSSGLKEVGV